MSVRSRVLAAGATLVMAGVVSAAQTLFASAATPACGKSCIEIFTPAFGTAVDPHFVEGVLQGQARVGQPMTLQHASGSEPAEDLMVPRGGLVSDFFADGLVSAAVNRHYGGLRAAQIEYAPSGVVSGLCVGLARTAFQNEGLSLQPCSVPATTVWIVDTADSLDTAAEGYFPLVNGSTRNYSHPYAMTYPSDADPADEPEQIRVRHLRFSDGDDDGTDGTVPDRQLWGIEFGVLGP